LKTGYLARACAEPCDGLAQLVGLGSILGIEDDCEFAARESEGIVAGSGFGARRTSRNSNDVKLRVACTCDGRRNRGVIIGTPRSI
jgi:hypothetical protein